MSKTKTIVIGAVITAGALTPIVVQHQANVRLKAEIESLRARLAAPRETQPISAAPDELQRLRREHEELMRLRGELATLRQQGANQTKAQISLARNDQAKANSKADPSFEAKNAQDLLAKSPEIPMIPAKLWVNAGVANPASAFQTMNWATVSRDTNALLKTLSLDPKARELGNQIFARLPESIRQKYGTVDGLLVDWRLNLGAPTAYRVLSQTEQGPDDATLVVQFQYDEGRVRENQIQLYRDETGGWRQEIPPQVMEKLPHVVNSLAESPTAKGR